MTLCSFDTATFPLFAKTIGEGNGFIQRAAGGLRGKVAGP